MVSQTVIIASYVQVMGMLTVDTGFLLNHQRGELQACQNMATLHFLEGSPTVPTTHSDTQEDRQTDRQLTNTHTKWMGVV